MIGHKMLRQLEHSTAVYRNLLADITEQQARWKPTPEKWSILEVLCHLIDEERDDFRQRIRLTLQNPDQQWPGIDPESWARDRKYNSRKFPEMRQAFFRERNESLQWLKNTINEDWEKYYTHPTIGKLKAGDLLASWITHDWLHIRQVSNLTLQWLKMESEPYSVRYSSP